MTSMTSLTLYLAFGVASTAWLYLIHAPECEACRPDRSDLWMWAVNVLLWPVWVALRIRGIVR